MEQTPDILIFLGRFHALVVHLPIGFVCIALLIEFFFRKKNNANGNAQPLINFIWLLAAFSATVSVVLGYLLSLQGGYEDSTLNLHKWSGIVLALVIHVCYFLKTSRTKKSWSKYAVLVSLGICTILLMVTGHYGGSLTHGSGYLSEFKPTTFTGWFGATGGNVEQPKKISSLDSADIFTDAVMPIIKAKCASCHNAEKKKGNLVMLSYEDLLKGGEEGPAIVPGDLEKSGIFHRITLPADDKKFMPTDGKKPLTNQQLAIIKWWIEKQAPKTGMINTLQPDSAMRKIFTAYLGINEANNTLALVVPPADPEKIEALTEAGFKVSALAEKNNLLQATLNAANGDAAIPKLNAIKEQLVWLKINGAGKLDNALATIGQLINLRKLTINNSELAATNISHLSTLPNLEYLNLYSTPLQLPEITSLLQIKNLKQLYIDGTGIDTTAMNTLSSQFPHVKIVYQQPEELGVDSIEGRGQVTRR